MSAHDVTLKGKNALAFGATNGIGRAVSLDLGQQGANVTVVGRNAKRGQEVASSIGGVFRACDASLLCEVRRVVVDAVSASPDHKIDICVFTQGIASVHGRTETSEGLDVKMALNYY